MELSAVVSLQIVLFLLIACGIVLSKLNIITTAGRKTMTDLLIYFILPCNIYMSYLGNISTEVILSSGRVLLVAFAIQFMSILFSKILYFKISNDKQMVMRYGTICSNAGFIGLPVVEQIYGQEGLFLASIALIPLRIFMWSSGLACFTNVDAKTTIRKLLTHPCIIAVVLGFITIFTKLRLPMPIYSTVKYCSSSTTAISMLVIGSILSEVDIKKVIDKEVIYISFVRLLLIPIVSFVLLNTIYPTGGLSIRIPVLLAAMPVGSTAAILAAKYEGDQLFAAKCVCSTSIFSLVTLPVVFMMF